MFIIKEKLRLGWRSFWRGLSAGWEGGGEQDSRRPAVEWQTGRQALRSSDSPKTFRLFFSSFPNNQPLNQVQLPFSLSYGQPEPKFLSLGSFMLGGRVINHHLPLYLLLLNPQRVGAGRKVGDTFACLDRNKQAVLR